MPRVRHWFHVSHDINSDGEVWELTDKFGVAGLRLWLELLSIADRNEGKLPQLCQAIYRQLSIKCNTTQTRVRLVCDWTITRSWVVCDPTPRIRNWREYNPTRDAKRDSAASPPTPPPPPSDSYPNKNEPAADSSVKETKRKELDPEIRKWADQVYNVDKQRYAKLAMWIRASERENPPAVIARALERYLPYARGVTDWFPYLSKILDKERAINNARQAERDNNRMKHGAMPEAIRELMQGIG